MRDDLPLLGFGLPVSGGWATPGSMVRVARRAEELGYASLWTFQRLLQPAPGELDPAYAEEHNPGSRPVDDPAYHAVHDPLLPLAYVAAHTERIGLGTATICAPFTPPALLAKATATLDHLCGGRLTVGLGTGWLPQEYAATGVPFERRGARMEEYLRCLTAQWADDPVEFAGDFYTVPRSSTGVKPLQRPHPPVLLGGAAPAALHRAGRLADGWIAGSRHDVDQVARSVALVREGAERAGRDPQAVRILVRTAYDGTRERLLEHLAALREVGVTEAFVDLNLAPERTSDAEQVLDALAPAAW